MALFERRKYERFDFLKELIIFADNPLNKKEIQYYAKTLNISRGGLLIYTIAQFKEKTKCIVHFRSNKLELIERKGTILRVVTNDRPDYLKDSETMYAFEFNTPFSTDDVVGIIERLGT